MTAGQVGSIFINQDGIGSRTLSWSSYWLFPSGNAPTLSTGLIVQIEWIILYNHQHRFTPNLLVISNESLSNNMIMTRVATGGGGSGSGGSDPSGGSFTYRIKHSVTTRSGSDAPGMSYAYDGRSATLGNVDLCREDVLYLKVQKGIQETAIKNLHFHFGLKADMLEPF